MGRHSGRDHDPTLIFEPLPDDYPAIENEGLDQPDHYKRNMRVIIFSVMAAILLIMFMGARLFSSPAADPARSPESVVITDTVTETETVRVPGPTVTQKEPGPTVFKTVIPAPLPGPTVTVTRPAPTVTKTVTRETPGPTVTKTVTETVTAPALPIP